MAHNLGWKLVAVALAYLLWLKVVEEPQAIRQLEVPVRFEQLAPNLAQLHDRPSSIMVRVRAAEPIAKALQPLDIEARVDLSDLGVGTRVIRLSPDSPFIVPRVPGLTVVEVFPQLLEVSLEPRLTAEVTVRTPRLVGSPAAGFEVTSVDVVPRRIRIQGPESAVQVIAEAHTREVVIDGRSESFEQELRIDVADPDIVLLSGANGTVRVKIQEILGEITFAEMPLSAIGARHEARLSPEIAEIALSGPSRVLDQLQRQDIVAYVDLEGIVPGAEDYRRPVLVTFSRDLFRERLQVTTTPDEIVVRIVEPKNKTGGT